MNRMERMTAILIMLQEKQRTASEIADQFEVSKRTILRDIQGLCEIGVPIISKEGVNGGYQLMPDYMLAPVRLSFRETLLLLLGLSSIQKLADAPYSSERSTLTAKLRAIMPEDERILADKWMANIHIDIPERSYKAPLLETLLEYAHTGQWITGMYKSSTGNSNKTLLPKRLYTHNGFWYCEAYSFDNQEDRTYRVDRFIEIHPAPVPEGYNGPNTAYPYEHADNPEVIIELTREGVRRMEGERHYAERIQMNDDGSGRLQFRCPPSEFNWLSRYLLSFGTDAKILSPKELAERVCITAKNIIGQYETVT